VSRPAGSLRVFFITAFCLFLTSCIFIQNEKPLNPRLLFTVGSEFLASAENIALKGSIDYRDADNDESGSFQLVMNHGDSLAFFIEGPLKIDVFRLIIIGGSAYAWDRESGDWVISPENDESMMSDYGIENVSPVHLGLYLFPQFYLKSGLNFDPEKMTLSLHDKILYIEPSQNQGSFSIMDRESGLLVSYGRRQDFGGGFYASNVEITSPGQNWRITLRIEKIRPNPDISADIWARY
jgi:hypothetical protein